MGAERRENLASFGPNAPRRREYLEAKVQSPSFSGGEDVTLYPGGVNEKRVFYEFYLRTRRILAGLRQVTGLGFNPCLLLQKIYRNSCAKWKALRQVLRRAQL